MFFEGNLSEGIGHAVSQRKAVLCFVTNDRDESLKWESWLKNDQELASVISATSILLRLEAGGQEAGYLAAFCPLDSTPALIVIRNGVPTAHLKSGLAEEDFKTAALDALREKASSTVAAAGNSVYNPPATVARSSSAGFPAHNGEISTTSKTTQSEAATKKRYLSEQTRRAAELKKSQSDALAERRRILREIESDKREREAQQQRQQALREEEREVAEAEAEAEDQVPFPATDHDECALRIRTFDGTTISATFSVEETLQDGVRDWIYSQVDNPDAPYQIKQVRAPKPSRTFDTTEEKASLADLGLAPTATLVMVPLRGDSTAYGGGGYGVIGNSLSYVYGVLSSVLGMASSLVGSFFGRGSVFTSETASQAPQPSLSSSNTRVRTLADQRRDQDDQQLYNGNQLNFERRKDDVDEQQQ